MRPMAWQRMEWFRDAPIKRKLLFIGLLTSGFALLFVGLVMSAMCIFEWRARTTDELATHARIIGANAAPAMLFDDRKAAAEILSALSAKPDIVHAAIYDNKEKEFAAYITPGHSPYPFPYTVSGAHWLAFDNLVVSSPVRFKNELLGNIFLESDLRGLYMGVLRGVGLVFLTAFGVFLLTAFLFARLQKTIVAPIADMAGAMRNVIAEQDFAARVQHHGKDEIGALAGTFNTMLEYIQLRDAELERHRAHLEEEVALRTARLTEAQRIAHLGNWEWNIAGDKLDWSDEIYRIFGLEPQQFGGTYEAFLQAIHPEDRQFVEERVSAALERGQTYSADYRIVLPDDTVRHVHGQAEVSRDGDGHLARMLGTVQDITERKQTEAELQLRAQLLDSVSDTIFLLDLDGNFVYLNEAAWKTRGYTRDEMMEIDLHTLDTPKFKKLIGARFKEIMEKGQSIFESEHRRKDGSVMPVEINARTIELGGRKLLLSIIRDISERHRAEAKMSAINTRLATLVETIPDIVIFKDGKGRWLIANEPAKQLFRLHDIPWQGKTSMELAGLRPELREVHTSCLAGDNETWMIGKLSLFEEKVTGAKGGLRTFEAYKVPSFNDDGSRNGLVIVARDITGRKQAEAALQSTARELEQANAQIEEERAQLAERVAERTEQLLHANRAKDSFLATMSHEIRTPLGGLLGMMELIGLSRLGGKQREMLQAARDSGQSLLRIVNDILDWSKIEAGKLELSPQAATIPDILNGVVSTYSPLASAKGLMLRQRVDDKLGAAHIFDPLRLSQILNNFTSNAIKFTEQGTVEISAERTAQSGGNEEVLFCVKDSGIGINQEQQAHLFELYEQASVDTARMYGGTGLGLAICRSLAELMEGTLSVESAPGRGSVFCLTLSLPVASQAAQRDLQLRQARGGDIEDSRDNIPGIAPLAAGARRVLVVDDHPINRMLLKQQLEQLGLHAEVAAYGIVALSLWWTGRFDLIITDCHMPEMDGYELTRSIREMEQHDGRQRVPIIAWTANVLAEEEVHCRAAGMDDMLTKPTDLADLRAMLSKWLAKADVPAAEAPLTSAKGAIPSPLAAAADTPIDFSMLKKIAKNPVAQVEMLQEFNLHNRGDIFNLNAALKDGDPAAVARLAHRIKGASRMVGALELDGICTAIEKAAMQGDMEGARRAAEPALGAAVERLEAAIGTFTGGQ